MKHNHPFFIGERVWDDYRHEWATVSMFKGIENEAGCLVLKNDNGELWEADYQNAYQIAEGLRSACSGDLVCYEHNDTEDGYPYYCPAIRENIFTAETLRVPYVYESDFTEGSAYELVQKLQDAVLAIDGAEKMTVPVFVEDENGRLENITHIWYDPTRQMIRLTVGSVEFQDSEE